MTALTIRRWLVGWSPCTALCREKSWWAGRALGALGFTRGEFSDSLRQQLVDRIDGQQPCFDSFQALGSPATVQLFRTQCHAGLDIEQLRRIACTRQPAADGGETALRWFGLQTQRLEQLREVEEQLIDDLLDATDALLADDAPAGRPERKTIA